MINKFLSIFVLLTFCLNNYSEDVDILTKINKNTKYGSSINQAPSVAITQIIQLSECHENDCHQTTEHCSHHCSGIHNIIKSTVQIILNINFLKTYKKNWYHKFLYLSLSIEPSLRPPLFS